MRRDFERVYASGGRSSVAPERLVRALVLQVLYSIRSERLLVEQLDYNLLFRWFVGLSMDDAVWDHSTFTKNRDRLIEAGVARKLLRRVGLGRGARDFCPPSTSASMARSSRRGRRSRACADAMGRTIRRLRDATRTWTSMGSRAPTRRTSPRTSRRRSSFARARAI